MSVTTTVLVICDHDANEDYCEAEFEVLRTGLPDDLCEVVDNQLLLRGWIGNSHSRTTCPLHIAEGKRRTPGASPEGADT